MGLLTKPQYYILDTLMRGNGFFRYANPADYSCDDGSHDDGERRTCACRAGWHAEDVEQEGYRDRLLWFMNAAATKSLFTKEYLSFDTDQQRGRITPEGRAAYGQSKHA